MFKKILYRSDMLKCVLCKEPPCSDARPKLAPAGLLRSIWFDNESGAAAKVSDTLPCLFCPAPCEEHCLRRGEVPIRALLTALHRKARLGIVPCPENENRLRTDFCGFLLENPFQLSSSG